MGIPTAARQTDTLEAILGRAGQYVQTLDRQPAGIIVEEDYFQEIRMSTMTGLGVGRERSIESISRTQTHGEVHGICAPMS